MNNFISTLALELNVPTTRFGFVSLEEIAKFLPVELILEALPNDPINIQPDALSLADSVDQLLLDRSLCVKLPEVYCELSGSDALEDFQQVKSSLEDSDVSSANVSFLVIILFFSTFTVISGLVIYRMHRQRALRQQQKQEDALADRRSNVETGLPTGWQAVMAGGGIESEGGWAAPRNGVLDVRTGPLRPSKHLLPKQSTF